MWNNEDLIQRDPKTPWQTLDNESILLSPADSLAHELNETATWVWNLIEEPISLELLIVNFCEEFEVDLEVAKKDLVTLLLQFHEKKLLVSP